MIMSSSNQSHPRGSKRTDEDWDGYRRDLTPAEIRILQGMAAGMWDYELADIFGIKTLTMKKHVKRIYRVLRAKNRSHAVAIAFRKNLIH